MKQSFLTFPNLPDQFPLGTDSVLLAAFASLRSGASVFDLGAGCGTLGMLLGASHPDCCVDGIELQPAAVAAAQEIIRQNGMEGRVSVMEGDLRQLDHLPAKKYDAVVSNPPYFPVGSGARSPADSRALSRTELCCTLEELSRAASRLLRSGGSFFLVHRPERLCDLMVILRAFLLEPKRMRLVRNRPGAPPSLVLLESRKDGKCGLSIGPDLLLRGEDGAESEEYRQIYHLGGT